VTRINERLRADLPVEAAFDFIADFANASAWDPGTVWSRRTAPGGVPDGPVGLGASFELGVRMGGRIAPVTYRITEYDRPTRVVLVGEGSGVESVDDIRFERTGDGTAIDYAADITLHGALRLLQPFLGGTFRRIGRDAAAGMADALAGIAASSDQPEDAR